MMGKEQQAGSRGRDRRGSGDRRLSTERRRGSDARDVVFEVCRSTLHLAVVVPRSGGDAARVITRSLVWRKASTSLFTEAGARELEDAFRTLVEEERLAGAQVRIALGGAFCVTRVVSGGTDDVRRECAEIEERSARYLTLGPGRKILAASAEQLDARHEHALLSVANERTVELLLRIADAVGVHVARIEPSLVALSRAQASVRGGPLDACFLIQLDERGAELGVSQAGRLLLDYRPGGQTDATNVADLLAQHVTRLQRNVSRQHHELKSPIRQVYLAGDADAVARGARQFARFPQFDVSVLEPDQLDVAWQFASGRPGPEFAAALGTALLASQPEAEKRGPNLLERVLAESRAPLRPVLVRSLLPVAAALLVALILGVLYQWERMATATARAELDRYAAVRARASHLQRQMMAADAKRAELEALRSRLAEPNFGQLLTRIAQSLPEDVWLDSLTFRDGRTASLTGASYGDSGVYDFVGYLKRVPDIEQIALEGTGVGHSPTGPITSFDLQLSLASPSNYTDRRKFDD